MNIYEALLGLGAYLDMFSSIGVLSDEEMTELEEIEETINNFVKETLEC